MIFLHAGVADRRMWQAEQAALSGSWRTIAYDRREFGDTNSPDVRFSHVDDLAAVIRHFDVDMPVLVGASQGGRIAIDYALANPGQVRALVLMAPAVSGAPGPGDPSDEIAAVVDKADAAEEADDLDLINAAEAHMWLDGPTSAEGRVGGAARELFLDMNGKALVHEEMTKEIEPPNAWDRLGDLDLPVSIIWGDLDFPHVQERCEYIAANVPGAKAHKFPGCAHMVNLERSSDTITGIDHFTNASR